jgi:hypothetical protein
MDVIISTVRDALDSSDPDLVGISITLGCAEQLLARKDPGCLTDIQVFCLTRADHAAVVNNVQVERSRKKE